MAEILKNSVQYDVNIVYHSGDSFNVNFNFTNNTGGTYTTSTYTATTFEILDQNIVFDTSTGSTYQIDLTVEGTVRVYSTEILINEGVYNHQLTLDNGTDHLTTVTGQFIVKD